MSISIIAPKTISLAAGIVGYTSPAGDIIHYQLDDSTTPKLALLNNWTERLGGFDVYPDRIESRSVGAAAQISSRHRNIALGNHSDGTYRVGFRTSAVTSTLNYFGISARTPNTGTSGGYGAVLYNGLLIMSITEIDASPSVAFSPTINTDYQLELIVSGTSLTANVYNADGGTLLATVSRTDDIYTTGYFELFARMAAGESNVVTFFSLFPTNTPAATLTWDIPGNSIADIAECLDIILNPFHRSANTEPPTFKYMLNDSGSILPAGAALDLATLKSTLRAAATTVRIDSLRVYINLPSDRRLISGFGILTGGGLHVVDPVGGGIIIIDEGVMS